MKKLLFIAAAACAVFLGCKTTGTGTDTGSNPISQKQAEAELKEVYEEYKGDIILEGATAYTVVAGDELNKIARAQYDNGYYFPLIMLASSNVVLDPDRIEPGMKLTVPDLQRNLNNPGARTSLKKFLLEVAAIYDKRHRPEDASGLRNLSGTL